MEKLNIFTTKEAYMLKKGLVFSALLLSFSVQAPSNSSCCSLKQRRLERTKKIILQHEAKLRITNLQYLIYFAETRFEGRKQDPTLFVTMQELVEDAKLLLQNLIDNNMIELWNKGEAESVKKLMWMVQNYNDFSLTKVPRNL